MLYGKTKRGTQLHMIVDGAALCGIPNVTVTDLQPKGPGDASACGNCDNELRERGKMKAPPPPPKPDRRTFYTPRYTFDLWARGLAR